MLKHISGMTRYIFAALVALFLAIGCGDTTAQGDANNTNAQTDVDNDEIFLMTIANPDKSLNKLLHVYVPDKWETYRDVTTEIAATNAEGIALNVGMRSANALLSMYLGDYNVATNMGQSIKEAVEKLDVPSEDIEGKLHALKNALDIEDENVRGETLRKAINELRDRIITVLDEMGSRNLSLLIQFGSWIEGMRQSSGIVLLAGVRQTVDTRVVVAGETNEDGTPKTKTIERVDDLSTVIYRMNEASYFKKQFAKLLTDESLSLYRAAAEQTDTLIEQMEKTKIEEGETPGLTAEGITNVHDITAKFVDTYRE